MKPRGIAPTLGLLLLGVIGLFPPLTSSGRGWGWLPYPRRFLFEEGGNVDGGRLLAEVLIVVSACGLWLLWVRDWIDSRYHRV